MKLSFFGLGYVGIIHSTAFASKGFRVIGYDIDKEKVRLLGSGVSPIYEPGLDALLKRCLKNGSLKITTSAEEAVIGSDATFITVGTPNREDGSIDLKYAVGASKAIGTALKKKKGWHLVVIKSTVVPGTTKGTLRKTIEGNSGKEAYKDFGLAVNPEFLREGNAIEDFMKPDKIVIGANDQRSRQELKKIYSTFACPIVATDLNTAELIKYANNTFLAMKVSFINMVANLCQKIPGTDVEVVARSIGLDKRIGPLFLMAGPGWGGSCWPKDLNALKRFAEEIGVDVPLIDSTLSINSTQPYTAIELARKLIGELKDRMIAVLGLSFKQDTDDMREAVSIKIVNKLVEEGADVVVYDPMAMRNAKKIFGDRIKYAPSAVDSLKKAECALVITAWNEFKKLTPEDYIKHMATPAVVDGRRIYDPSLFSSKLKYAAIGLGARESEQGH